MATLKINHKFLFFVHLIVGVISLIALLFLPTLNIHIYRVYIYNLSRTEISHINFSFFKVAFSNNYFNASFVFLLLPVIIVSIAVLDFYYFKTSKKVFFYSAFCLSLVLICFQSFSNSIFASSNNIKTYCYANSFIDRYPTFPILFEQSHLYQESIWIDLGAGQIISIVFVGIKIAIYFFSLFLGKRFLNSLANVGSNTSTIAK